jgi:NADH:ubiquinone oxidoreductase subunit 2 (subunit N)
VLLPLVRSLSLLLVIWGWQNLPDAGPSAVDWRGASRQRPVAALTLGYGLLSLLGLPLAAGFPGRWAAVALIAAETDVSFWLLIGLLLAMGGGITGLWRILAPLLMREEAATSTTDAASALSAGVTGQPPLGVQIGLLLGVAAGVLLAVTPLALTFVQRLALLWLRSG